MKIGPRFPKNRWIEFSRHTNVILNPARVPQAPSHARRNQEEVLSHGFQIRKG